MRRACRRPARVVGLRGAAKRLTRPLASSSSTAAGGKTEDFMSAAKLFHRAKRQVKVPTYLVPATQKASRAAGKGFDGLVARVCHLHLSSHLARAWLAMSCGA